MEPVKKVRNQEIGIKKAMTKKRMIILLVIALLLTVYVGYRFSVRPISSETKNTVYVVQEGDTMNQTIDNLASLDYINSGTVTKIVASLFGINTVYPGNYSIDLSWDSITIIRFLAEQGNAESEATITLLPNDSALQIANKIAEQTNLNAEDIVSEWNNSSYIKTLMADYSVITDELLNDQLKIKLEGYLYPDTYRFNLTTTIDEVTRIILDNSQEKYETIADEIAKSNYSVNEIYSLASMIEWEASAQEDRNLVSSVFHNRLDIGMRLESSVTICYAIGEFDDWRECEVNPDVESPYNTMINYGLPVGPILNPTISSLQAALNPAESDYLFFLADPQTGNVYFSRTYEEHLEYYEKYLADQMEGE